MADSKLIVKLRELTGAGIVDCRNALEEAKDDFDTAVDLRRRLRPSGSTGKGEK